MTVKQNISTRQGHLAIDRNIMTAPQKNFVFKSQTNNKETKHQTKILLPPKNFQQRNIRKLKN